MPTTAEASLNRLLTQMEKSARFARASVRRAVAEFGTGWETDFTELLANLYGSDSALEEAVKGYGAFVMDSMRRQKRFERGDHRARRCATDGPTLDTLARYALRGLIGVGISRNNSGSLSDAVDFSDF